MLREENSTSRPNHIWHLVPPQEKWVKRRYEVFALPKKVEFRGPHKSWLPSGRTTCWQVPIDQLRDFEGIFLKPFFGFSLRDLARLIDGKNLEKDLTQSRIVLAAVEKELNRVQGFQPNARVRKAVELRAMEVVGEYFRELGYKVLDVSATQPYDLKCRNGQHTKFVEVKGAQGQGLDVVLTAGEVKFIQSNTKDCIVCVVHGIQVKNTRKPRADGGELDVQEPFDLSTGRLNPITFLFHRKSVSTPTAARRPTAVR